MRPRTWRGWTTAAVVLLGTGVVATQFFSALARAIYLVDAVPGADAGIGTSPALVAARVSATTWGLVLLGLGGITGVVLLLHGQRRLRQTSTTRVPPGD